MRVLAVLFFTVTGIVASFSNAFYGVLLYAWYSIFSPVDFIWWTIGVSSVNLSFGVAGTTIITAMTQGRKLFLMDRNTIVSTMFLVACCFSLIVRSDVSPGAWNQWWLLARILFMMFVTAALIDNIQKLKIFIIAVALYTGLLGAYYGYSGLINGATWITGPGGIGGGRFGDNNGYAAWLCTTLPIIWFVGASMKHKFWRAFGIFIFLGNIIAVILTFSRAGTIVASCVLTLMLFAVKRKGPYFLFLAAFLITIGTMISSQNFESKNTFNMGAPTAESVEDATGPSRTLEAYKKRAETIKTYEKENSALGRMHFWQVAIIMANENPALGVGFMSFNRSYDLYDDADGFFGRGRSVHSTWLDSLACTGYVGFGLFVTIIITAFFNINTFIAWVKREKMVVADEFIGYSNMIRIALVAYILGGIFVNTFFHDILWNMLAISAAMANVARTGALEYKGSMKWERYIWEKL